VPRIVIDARSVVARQSGIGNYVAGLTSELVRLAPDWSFLLLKNPAVRNRLIDAPNVREAPFVGETKSVTTVFRLGRAFDFFRGYDLYHSPADLVPLGIRRPWAVTIHDLMWIEARRLASAFPPVRWANAAWYTYNIERAVRGARVVISISQATADAIGRVYPEHAHKVHVVRHGVDHARFDPERAPPRSALDAALPPGVDYSLIIGQGSPYKNHPGMLRAFLEAIPGDAPHRLVLVRRFSRVDFEMQRLLAHPDAKERVIVLSHVTEPMLLALLRHAKMLLFASHYEGFGLPALEAMCMGTPVLASTAPAVVEVTADAALHAGSDDHTALVESIRRLDQDAELRTKLSEAGRRRAAEFTWRRAAELTLAAYRAALE